LATAMFKSGFTLSYTANMFIPMIQSKVFVRNPSYTTCFDYITLETKLTVELLFTLFLMLDCEAIGTAATPGLLCQPRVIVKMIVEKQMECRLTGENEILGEILPQRQFCPSQSPT
jgi:hypothetical protein